MNGKRMIALLLVMITVINLAACGAKEAPVAEATPEEVRETVIIAIGDEPTTLDPTKGWGHGNAPIMQSTLVRYDADMTFVNDLATDYKYKPLTLPKSVNADRFICFVHHCTAL